MTLLQEYTVSVKELLRCAWYISPQYPSSTTKCCPCSPCTSCARWWWCRWWWATQVMGHTPWLPWPLAGGHQQSEQLCLVVLSTYYDNCKTKLKLTFLVKLPTQLQPQINLTNQRWVRHKIAPNNPTPPSGTQYQYQILTKLYGSFLG